MLRALRTAAAALALLALTSCTRSFIVTAGFADGVLTFESANDEEMSYPWCWQDFTVASEDGQPAWSFEVPYGAFRSEDRCGPHFPLRYGQAPPRAETTIAAARIQPGRLYIIEGTAADGLRGAFRITRSGNLLSIENVDPDSAEAVEAMQRVRDWKRSHDLAGTGRTSGERAQHESLEQPPLETARDAAAGPAGTDEYGWLLNASNRSSFPSLSYAALDVRRIRFDLWCRWRGAVIIGRLTDMDRNASALQLSSGEHQLSTSLDRLREPHDGFPVGGVLAENDPVLRAFGETGQLTLRLGNETLAMNAIDERERQTVRRFFELCFMERPGEPPLPWRQPQWPPSSSR